MTERDQRKLIKAGYRLIRRNLKQISGKYRVVIEEKTEKSEIWVMVRGAGHSDMDTVEQAMDVALKCDMCIRLD